MDRKIPEDFHALYDRGFQAAHGVLPVTPQLETAGLERLSADMPDLVVDYDEATQLPKYVASRRPDARLAAPPADSPEDAVTQFIQNQGDLWNLTPQDAGT